MDQSELLVILGGLYDKLVSDVAAHVNQKRSEALTVLIDERIAEHKLIREDAIGDVVDSHIHNLDDKISDWMDNNLRDKVMDTLANEDISDDISNWMSNNFDLNDYNVDDAIESWADNNLDDKITDAVNNLSFTVEVSR